MMPAESCVTGSFHGPECYTDNTHELWRRDIGI